MLFRATAEGDELSGATRAQRNAWLDEQLRALSADDRAVIARAAALLSDIAAPEDVGDDMRTAPAGTDPCRGCRRAWS
ncbi:hypothetical protein ACFQ51_48140 [Streptomyces kaempferi]